jgi:hypothetical protein
MKKKLNFILDILLLAKYNSLMMKNLMLMPKQAQKGLKPGINNILRLAHHELHFTRSEIFVRSIHVKSFFAVCLGVSSSVSEVSWSKSQHYRRIPCYFNKSTALNHGKCINTCEPAAVLVFLQRIKVVELRAPESAAAGHFEVKCKNKAKQKKEDKK